MIFNMNAYCSVHCQQCPETGQVSTKTFSHEGSNMHEGTLLQKESFLDDSKKNKKDKKNVQK